MVFCIIIHGDYYFFLISHFHVLFTKFENQSEILVKLSVYTRKVLHVYKDIPNANLGTCLS